MTIALPSKFTFTHQSEDGILYNATIVGSGKSREVVVNRCDEDNQWSGTVYVLEAARAYVATGVWKIVSVDSDFVFQVLSDDNEWVEISEDEYEIVKRLTSTPVRKLQIVE